MIEFIKKFFKRDRTKQLPIITPKPEHVAVIMDGNGRWANAKGLSRVAGHKRGVDSVKGLIKSCLQHEIPYLSIFAFSSENWSRPADEVNALMDLLVNALETQTKKLNENGVRLQLIGDLSKFSDRIQALAADAQAKTSKNDKLVFNVAINYGGRWDVTQACRKLAAEVSSGDLLVGDITEGLISENLSTQGMPDPDLFIRTSGEYRISNFMLWQAAYSEFYFSDLLWPDFDEDAFTDALLKYTHRDRRFGTAKDKVPIAAGRVPTEVGGVPTAVGGGPIADEALLTVSVESSSTTYDDKARHRVEDKSQKVEQIPTTGEAVSDAVQTKPNNSDNKEGVVVKRA